MTSLSSGIFWWRHWLVGPDDVVGSTSLHEEACSVSGLQGGISSVHVERTYHVIFTPAPPNLDTGRIDTKKPWATRYVRHIMYKSVSTQAHWYYKRPSDAVTTRQIWAQTLPRYEPLHITLTRYQSVPIVLLTKVQPSSVGVGTCHYDYLLSPSAQTWSVASY